MKTVILLKIQIRDIIFEKKRRNFIARDLFSVKYKKRIVKPKKAFDKAISISKKKQCHCQISFVLNVIKKVFLI